MKPGQSFSITLAVLVATCMSAAAYGEEDTTSKIFKTKSEDGVTVFSDQAIGEAQEITVDEPVTYKGTASAARPNRPKSTKDEKTESIPLYESIAILSPSPDEAIRSNPGDVTITYAMSPGLRTGHKLSLFMDGTAIRDINGSGPISLSNVDRGTHTVQLKVLEGSSGSEFQASQPVSFTILRVAIQKRTP